MVLAVGSAYPGTVVDRYHHVDPGQLWHGLCHVSCILCEAQSS